MKHIKKSQMLFVEGQTGEDFQRNYNSAMDNFAEQGINVDEKLISLEQRTAVILYTQTVEIAETLKDRYALKGIFPVCRDCPYYEAVTDYTGVCPFLRVDKRGSGNHYADDDICDKRWRELEEQERYQKRRFSKRALSKLGGRACAARCDTKEIG